MLSAGLSKIGSNNVAIISGIGPVSTILQAHWVLGEKIHTAQIIGTVMVVAGVLLTGWKAGKRETIESFVIPNRGEAPREESVKDR